MSSAAAAAAAAATASALGPRLAGRVALVTGAAGGIGRETALLFARHGARVIATDLNLEGAEETAHIAATAPNLLPEDDGEDVGTPRVVPLQVDVADSASVAAAVDEAENRWGRLDVLFNNAGLMHSDDGDAVSTPDDVWDITMNVNVKGVLHGCRHAIPAMRRNPGGAGGSIINTASFVACIGAATPQLAYTASKGAVLALTRELATVHARESIRVNALCPGPLNTELLQKFLDDEEKRQRRLVHVPMGRFGEAAEMARGALFLASDDSSFVTGSSFLVDGGITAAYVTAEDDGQVDPFGGPAWMER